MDAIIRFSNGKSDLVLNNLALNTSIKQIKDAIREQRVELQDRQLRLILSGKILVDSKELQRAISQIAPPRTTTTTGDETTSTTTTSSVNPILPRIIIQCAIGGKIRQQQDEERGQASGLGESSGTSGGPSATSTSIPSGFDRLRSAGFTAEDIENLRNQFEVLQSSSSTDSSRERVTPMGITIVPGVDYTPNTNQNDDRHRHQLDLEDRWIDETVGGTSTVPSNGANPLITQVYTDLVIGTCVGYFLGLIALVFLREGSSLFSDRQQKAIIAGLLVNVSFSLFKVSS